MTRATLRQSRPSSAYDYKGGDAGYAHYRDHFNKEMLVSIVVNRDETIYLLRVKLARLLAEHPEHNLGSNVMKGVRQVADELGIKIRRGSRK